MHALLLVIRTLVNVGLYRASPVVVALALAGSRYGLLNKPWMPFAGRSILAILLLDLAKYAIHRGIPLGLISLACASCPSLRSGLRCLDIRPCSSD
jgi:hypothetical protein